MRNKTRRNAANIAGRGRQRRPAPAQLPSPKETAFAGALAAAPPAPPAPAPQGPAAPLVSSYSAPPQGAGHYQGPADIQLGGLGYAKGGKVRGYGMARGGKPCKMR